MIKGVFFGVVACKLLCVLMALLCGGVWRDEFFPMFSYGVEVSMENFQILSKVSVEGFAPVNFLLSVSVVC